MRFSFTLFIVASLSICLAQAATEVTEPHSVAKKHKHKHGHRVHRLKRPHKDQKVAPADKAPVSKSPTIKPALIKAAIAKPAIVKAAAVQTADVKAIPKPAGNATAIVGNSHQLIQVVDPACGANGASLKISDTSGPNGAASWLTCGISKTDTNSGWTPPRIQLSDLVTQDLSSFQTSTFKACAPFISMFQKYGQENGIPPIFLAAFAMQESSCQPGVTGDGGGAFGLMQITSDKCGGAPDGDCHDPDFNIRTGAAYFKSQLDASGGDVLLALGSYNGWSKGLTFAQATEAASGSCCVCQNNLDYLSQFLNGWLQGVNHLGGVFNNLAVCGK